MYIKWIGEGVCAALAITFGIVIFIFAKEDLHQQKDWDQEKLNEIIEDVAQYLESRGMTVAGLQVRMLKQGKITKEDHKWAEEKIKEI